MRGNSILTGYHNKPDETEEAFKGGWFHSGDVAVWHPDGYVELRDRSKDIIISGGENISSIEVEQAISKHPAVSEVAVVAMPDEKWGERPKAFVELKSGEDADEDDIISFCKENLAPSSARRPSSSASCRAPAPARSRSTCCASASGPAARRRSDEHAAVAHRVRPRRAADRRVLGVLGAERPVHGRGGARLQAPAPRDQGRRGRSTHGWVCGGCPRAATSTRWPTRSRAWSARCASCGHERRRAPVPAGAQRLGLRRGHQRAARRHRAARPGVEARHGPAVALSQRVPPDRPADPDRPQPRVQELHPRPAALEQHDGVPRDEGFDVFLLDWAPPDPADAENTLETYVDHYIPRAMAAATGRPAPTS